MISIQKERRTIKDKIFMLNKPFFKTFLPFFLTWCKLLSMEQSIMDTNKLHNKIPIYGDVVVSVVYIVDEIDDKFTELIDPIEDAYNIEGQDMETHLIDGHYFPAPLSYPFKFSPKGSYRIIEKLKTFGFIEPQSINKKYFPNIEKFHENSFSEQELEEILKEEEYISFSIKGWDNIEFMYFPAFLVMRFNYTRDLIKNYTDYQLLKKYWLQRIDEFNELKELRAFLLISREGIKWANTPILVFNSLGCSGGVEYSNRYYWGPGDEEERNEKFLKEVSLFDHESLDGFTFIHRFNNIIHEYGYMSVWRLYYSYNPIFNQNVQWHSHEQGKNSSRKTLIRVLRSAIFTHIVTIDGINRLKRNNQILQDSIKVAWDKRSQLFDVFSRKEIEQYQKYINDSEISCREIKINVGRIEEISKGLKKNLDYIGNPFLSPDTGSFIKINQAYNKLLHLENLSNHSVDYTVNDLKILKNANVQLVDLLSITQKNIETFESELYSSRELTESRINIIESRRNLLLSILLPALGAVIGCIVLYLKWKLA